MTVNLPIVSINATDSSGRMYFVPDTFDTVTVTMHVGGQDRAVATVSFDELKHVVDILYEYFRP